MATKAKALIEAYKANDGGFRFFSDWLDAKRVEDTIGDLAREMFARL